MDKGKVEVRGVVCVAVSVGKRKVKFRRGGICYKSKKTAILPPKKNLILLLERFRRAGIFSRGF